MFGNKKEQNKTERRSDLSEKNTEKNISRHIFKWKIFVLLGILALGIILFIVGTQVWFLYHGRKSYYSGEIIEITNGNLIIRGRGGIQETIAIERDTLVKKGGETMKDGLEIGDRVIVVGLPNERGQIEAKLVRILEGNEMKNMKRFLKPPFLDNNSEK